MEFKAKVFKLGNSTALYIPKSVYTEIGKVYTFEIKDVYTENSLVDKVITEPNVITHSVKSVETRRHKPYEICPKHNVPHKECGCY